MPWIYARALDVAASLATTRQDTDRALSLLREALDVQHTIGDQGGAADSLEALAHVIAGRRRPADAVRLLAIACRLRDESGIARRSNDEPRYNDLSGALRKQLPDEEVRQAWEAGSVLGIDEAIRLGTRGRGRRGRPRSGWDSLTPTELQIARLVAKGWTNPKIGERLFISPGTVKVHLSHIFGKLGMTSRAELSAEAARRGV